MPEIDENPLSARIRERSQTVGIHAESAKLEIEFITDFGKNMVGGG